MTQNYIERYWRDAKPADAIKEPPMVARFRYEDAEDWEYDLLVGWDRTDQCHWRSELDAFEHCQVYDAPDPGEGWRLIDSKSEQPIEGDEVWSPTEKIWKSRPYPERWFTAVDTYRRRIAPAVTYVPFTWEDREQLRGRWVRCVDAPENEWAINSMYIGGSGELRANGVPSDRLASGFIFLDTGKPVGKEVTQ